MSVNQKEVKELFEKFKGLTALVIGDVMVDSYVWGRVDRISPEAPVPVVSVIKKENRPGGAANVAVNIVALGAKAIMCSVTGNDEGKTRLENLMKESGISTKGIVGSNDRVTTIKTRIISSHQHVVRIDEEQTNPLTPADEEKLLQHIESILKSEKINVILFEDYNKGVLTPRIIEKVIGWANEKGIPTTVDPKRENFFAYKKVTLFKPNLKELTEGLKLDHKPTDKPSLIAAAKKLETELGHRISLITLSEKGVFVKDKEKSEMAPAHVRNISDVSGAGDTVIAVASLCLAAGLDSFWLAQLSNLSGGLVCQHTGVVPVNRDELREEALSLVKP
ncbi:MAG: bifunctional heptose 7-phosphate kinase/heptose 1-phosphate adenyltransferase [Flavobacteriales bacterium]